ncbi:ASCH domain-containing protein [Pantoea brenneri]|uniref:ASCH domain-containing protein n=1 Tax=Pantoea brenneri TaxID=472694 RepID=UPI00244C1F5D|nr:ASCH domain-containing protein [Pantoea brenneri]MDH1088691.1 ASCH domain-containing protein [Pantoea brenneri]
MQQLSIVPRLLPAVRRGEKTHTLRWQEGISILARFATVISKIQPTRWWCG